MPKTPLQIAHDLEQSLRARIRDAKDELASLSAQRELVARDVKEAAEALKALSENKTQLESQITEFEGSLKDLFSFSKETIQESHALLQEAQKVVGNHVDAVKGLSLKIETARAELREVEALRDATHKEIGVEQDQIARKRADLDLYRGRLEKAYAEHMPPGQKIVI